MVDGAIKAIVIEDGTYAILHEPTPELGTLALLGLGGLALLLRRQKREMRK